MVGPSNSEDLIGSLNLGDPIHLQNSDFTSNTIISIKLTGIENYRVWAAAMKLAISTRNKTGFIDGSCVKSPYTNSAALFNQWERSNSIVLSWLLNSVSEDLFLGQIFFDNAFEIHGFKRGELNVSEYYHKLDSLWREFDIMTKLAKCSCAARDDVSKHTQLIKLMKFLMGLNDVFQPIRRSLLSRETLTDVKNAFAIISREESHKGLASSSSGSVKKPQVSSFVAKSNSWTNNGNKRIDNNKRFRNSANNRGPNLNLNCTNCRKVGHIVDRCFDIIGYPFGYNKNHGPKPNGLRTFNDNFVSTSSEKGASLSFTNEQMIKIMNLINEAPSGSDQANMASRASFFKCKHSDFQTSLRPNDDGRDSDSPYDDGNAHACSSNADDCKDCRKYGLEKYVTYDNLNTSNYCFSTNLNKFSEPTSYSKAVKNPNWVEAMNNEVKALYRNNTWTICDLPVGRKAVGSNWLLKIKYKSTGEIERYKVRVVAKRFSQKEGFYYLETFSSIFKMSTVRYDIMITVKGSIVLSFYTFGLLAAKHTDTPLLENTILNHIESDDDQLLVNVGNYQRLVDAALKVLRYLKGSSESVIQINKNGKKQSTLSRSSAEAEYRSMAFATCEVMWLSNLLGDMGVKNLLPVVMYCDNSSALQIAANPVFHEKSKHFEIDVHLVREKVASGVIKTEKIHTSQQIADILTKGLGI
nr:hypothetical protein [Tanacetum cinerariifolium]